MKNNRKFLIGLLLVVFVILAACEKSTDDSSAPSDDRTTQNAKHEPAEKDLTTDVTHTDTTDTGNNDTNEKVDTPTNASKSEEDLSSNTTVSLKEEYLKKLNDTKKDMDAIQPADSSTYALKNVEGNRYDIWDGLLNEVYGVLKKQLPSEAMEQLRKEQSEWIVYRDNTAKEASLKYKGGTMEHLEYTTVLNNLTEERCFELVEEYMS